MNRYLIRALVAVLTFCIGLAVGYRPRESSFKYRHRCHEEAVFRPVRDGQVEPLPLRGITVENLPTDPLRLRYSYTKMNPGNSAKRLVEFTLDNDSGRELSGYAIGYSSGLPSNPNSTGGIKSVYNSDNSVPFVSINCDADKQLRVWVSSVDFKDGSRWTNPLHDH